MIFTVVIIIQKLFNIILLQWFFVCIFQDPFLRYLIVWVTILHIEILLADGWTSFFNLFRLCFLVPIIFLVLWNFSVSRLNVFFLFLRMRMIILNFFFVDNHICFLFLMFNVDYLLTVLVSYMVIVLLDFVVFVSFILYLVGQWLR